MSTLLVDSLNKKPDQKASKPSLVLIPKRTRIDPKQILMSPDNRSIPFTLEDATVGIENEIQAVVIGNSDSVDLPQSIKASNYFKNIVKKAKTGDSPKQVLTGLEEFLEENDKGIWENSWVRFPERYLTDRAKKVFETDLLANKQNPAAGNRADIQRFLITRAGESYVRIPISYLLKIALADVSSLPGVLDRIQSVSDKAMGHFLSDNTSPETLSFYTTPMTKEVGRGKAIADETSLRYLLSQLLIQYANSKFKLTESGQTARVYFAPNPPIRQRKLNELIPDSFYRELFMSPCLSGWDKGEEKHEYMGFCHKTLSNSQLNAIVKLKEAGIIVTNLVVLPNTSNTSLANNGTHISLGSKILGQAMSDPSSGFSEVEEKYYGDLSIKIIEHFLPLFVGSYSGSPYRLDFWDFHPEKVLGYLPHQLDFTHLRMMWRRWKKKAKLKFMGRRFTPFGPEWFDRIFSAVSRIRGDKVVDYRLLDYFVSLLSTDQSPALDGSIGNDERLKKDLSSMGVFDQSMTSYLLYRIRHHANMGFSGFEGRYYSQFENIEYDLGEATNLQCLLNALSYKYILNDQYQHCDIPDNPFTESERRQIFFGAAIGVPTFFILKNTQNKLLKRILQVTGRTRLSRRYNGYVRVHNIEYQKALVKVIKEDAADLVKMMNMESTIDDLQRRLDHPQEYSAAARLQKGIMDETGASDPMRLSGEEFNTAAETYYRETLRKKQISQALQVLKHDALSLSSQDSPAGASICEICKTDSAGDFIDTIEKDVESESLSEDMLIKLIHLALLVIDGNKNVMSKLNLK